MPLASWKRSSVRSLSIWFVALSTITLAVAVTLSFLLIHLQDRNSRSVSESLVRGDIDRRMRELNQLLLDYGYWDQAVANIVHDFDPEWIDSEFGEYLHRQGGIDVVQVVDGQDRTVLRVTAGVRQDPAAAAAPGPDRMALARAARASADDAEPEPAAGFTFEDGALSMTAALRMTSYDAENDYSTDHVLLFSRLVDEEMLASLEAANLVRNMRISRQPAEGAETSIPLAHYGAGADPHLIWRPALPGRRMIPAAIIGLTVFACVLAVIGFVFARQLGAHARQLTEARAAAEAANRMKSDFLAGMSHELRTPLNAVIGFSDIIRNQYLGPVGNPRYLEYAGDIRESGAHLLSLVDDLLDLSRIEAGKLELRSEPLDLEDLTRQAIRLVGHLAEEKDIELSWSADDDAKTGQGDAKAVRQILVNLLNNALKFTPEGGRVRCAITRTGPAAIEIAISDNGIGIGETDIPRVLEPFVQVDAVADGKLRGTGLGLPLAQRLAVLMGGTLRLESELGAGTTVRVGLPAAEAGSGERGQTAAHSA
ncbi:ATP-binding protein [Minwuia thermotolerans]|uniref:histidine kinase n=1 Tax=Minwuia thermotolerans TaxID=2056226 RepID=A0A2M9G4W2_9PROT|nr:ATP-binding protein [Minwuia thermotolerans]PJK30753.1 hypothetical protein CVT23_05125 [Minwuia thermotolerans]